MRWAGCYAALVMLATCVGPGEATVLATDPASDSLSVSRLQTTASGDPTMKSDFKTIELTEKKEGDAEKDSVTIPKTTYFFTETKVVNGRTTTGASDIWLFNEFKITFLSDVLPASIEDDLKKIPNLLIAKYKEQSSKFQEFVPLVNFNVSSPNPAEGLNTVSDTFAVSTVFTVDAAGKPYSKEQTLTGKEELTLFLGGTIPSQAIEIFDGDVLSDVVLIDPITFEFRSDSDVLRTSPTGADTFGLNIPLEKLATTAFAVTISSDVPVPAGDSLSLLSVGLAIIFFRVSRLPWLRHRF